MELKRIIAKDSKTATEMVLNQFGDNALIIANQKIKGKTELIVAIDIEDNLYKEKAAQTVADSGFNSALEKTKEKGLKKQFIELKSDENNDREKIRAKEIVSYIKDELTYMKKEIQNSIKSEMINSNNSFSQSIEPLVNGLDTIPLPIELRTMFLEIIRNQKNVEDSKKEIYKKLLSISKSTDFNDNFNGINFFFGLSGSGKTTMTCKIGNLISNKIDHNDIAIVSLMDNKIGSWSQIQLLSSQTGIGCFKANNLEKLDLLLNDLKDKQVVLIDTPGIEIEQNFSMLKKKFRKEKFHLLMSSHSSHSSVNKMLKKEWDSIIISKIDENINCWPLIKMFYDYSVKINAFGNSPNIMNFTRLKITDIIKGAVMNIPIIDESYERKNQKLVSKTLPH